MAGLSTVINANLLRKSSLKENKTELFNFLILAMGLIFGTVIYVFCEDYLTGELWIYFINFSTVFSSKSKLEILSGLLISHLPYILLMAVFGTSAIGTVLIYGISFCKVMGLGLIVPYIYSTYGLRGIEYNILVFFPGKILLLFSMIILMRICVDTSIKLYKLSSKGEKTVFRASSYLTKIAVTTLFFEASALIDFIAVSCFSSLFDFC